MNETRFRTRLNELKIAWKSAGPGRAIAFSTSGAEVRIEMRGGWVHLNHAFTPLPVRDDVETLTHLLELNGDLTVFRLAIDEQRRVELKCSWELEALTDQFVAFLVLEMFDAIDYLREEISDLSS
ncbi:hypothetical protein [Sorangium sp. So ce1389]|uniref:hypothetical protein n=1 Tax=Sorangium sp. So ce1389 TaxID=3133336 RepID=UPI003F60F765